MPEVVRKTRATPRPVLTMPRQSPARVLQLYRGPVVIPVTLVPRVHREPRRVRLARYALRVGIVAGALATAWQLGLTIGTR